MREIRSGTRLVRLSSEDRVLFPTGETKGDLWDYYAAIAPAIVPHLKNRPFTMKRWREGVKGGSFFQKQAPKGIPDWLPTRQFRTHPREGGERLVDFPLVNDELALLWMIQFHCIDMNAWYSRVDKPQRPDYVVFDLDAPETGDGFALTIEAAQLVRGALTELGLEGWAKTSGAGGIHVLVPIERRATFGQAHELSERVTRLLAARHPGVVTAEWLKAKRDGVFIDYHQNAGGKTIASAYSVRPKAGAPVSTPAPLGGAEAGPRRHRPVDGRGREARREARRPVRAGAGRRPEARARARPAARAHQGRRAPEAAAAPPHLKEAEPRRPSPPPGSRSAARRVARWTYCPFGPTGSSWSRSRRR